MTAILSLWENLQMDFDLQPTLRGNLVELRPLTADDYEALYNAANDPLIWEQHPEPNRYRCGVFQKFFDGAIESKGAFAVIEIASGKIIGSSRYYDCNPHEREVKIGYSFLTRDFWGGIHNPEMKKLMLDHAFRFVDRVLFEIGENNLRSQKAIQRIGAQFVGRAKLPGLDGTLMSMFVYAIARK